jgi:hypothetical protein
MLSSGHDDPGRCFRLRGVDGMARRLFVILAVLVGTSGAVAYGAQPGVNARVHSGEVCWDPDVEFPVPCDDDDD